MITIKMWEDKWIKNSTFAKIFSTELDQMNANEQNFLLAVDYDLHCNQKEVELFNLIDQVMDMGISSQVVDSQN